MTALTLTLKSTDDTIAFAARFSKLATPGCCLLLEGDIGAGKTFFARALIQAILGVGEDVPSPTFTLVQVYETLNFDIWHCDLYRLNTVDQTDELGLDQAFEDAFCMIEWPDRLQGHTPENAVTLLFKVDPNTDHRSVTVTGNISDLRLETD